MKPNFSCLPGAVRWPCRRSNGNIAILPGRAAGWAVKQQPGCCKVRGFAVVALAGFMRGGHVAVANQLQFLRGYFRRPNVVGAVTPSSRALAAALCEPYRQYIRPAKVLEVGAGTGAVTRHIGRLLREDDELDVCEIVSDFADILEREVLSRRDFAPAVAEGRVRLLRTAVQDIPFEGRYDFVISGLPLTAFDLRDVRDVFRVVQRTLKPGGVFSYFEYVGLRRTTRALAVGRRRGRIRLVSAYLTRRIRDYQFDRRTVLWNILPAHARYLTFDDGENCRGVST